MTALEALTQALVEVEESKLTLTDEGPEGDPCIGCGDAAAILDALPEGWALLNVVEQEWSNRLLDIVRDIGAQRERERLRGLALEPYEGRTGYGRCMVCGEDGAEQADVDAFFDGEPAP